MTNYKWNKRTVIVESSETSGLVGRLNHTLNKQSHIMVYVAERFRRKFVALVYASSNPVVHPTLVYKGCDGSMRR